MSYLCPGKMEIGYSLTRRRLRNGYRKESLTRIGKIPATKAELLMMAIRFKVFQRDRSMTSLRRLLVLSHFTVESLFSSRTYTQRGGNGS